MLTIFGATGNTGSVVARDLLAKGQKVRLPVRDPGKVEALAKQGAEVVVADLLDPESIARALEGAEGAYLLAPPDPSSSDLVGRGRRIVDGFAKVLGGSSVKHVVLLSSIAAHEPEGTGPIVITHHAEKALGAVAGVTLTALRAAYFMENVAGFAAAMKGDGVLPVFGGGEGARFPMIATEDIGHVAAASLLSPPAEGDVIELSGPEEYSFEDAAAIASDLLGRPVKATPVPLEAMVPTLTSFGLSENVAGLYREMTEGMGKGLVRWDGKGRAVRGKVSLRDVLAAALA
jgi:uncharacterized protein YbjT (DUF2867 family)